MFRRIYLSPFGLAVSLVLNALAILQRPFMVYGYRDQVSGRFRKLTRVSSNAVISNRRNVSISDQVWIWHHSIIDGSQGVTIGEGAQVGAWVGIFSHGSHVAIRLHGRDYIHIDKADRAGYTRAPVDIGAFSFIGAGAIILPGATIGRGSLVAAGSVVSGAFPPFSIIRGNPAKVAGDTRALDVRQFTGPPPDSYFDQDGLQEWLSSERRRA